MEIALGHPIDQNQSISGNVFLFYTKASPPSGIDVLFSNTSTAKSKRFRLPYGPHISPNRKSSQITAGSLEGLLSSSKLALLLFSGGRDGTISTSRTNEEEPTHVILRSDAPLPVPANDRDVDQDVMTDTGDLAEEVQSEDSSRDGESRSDNGTVLAKKDLR